MTAINLLPWREALRKERQQKFLTALGGAVGAMALVMGAVHLQVAAMVELQNNRNGYMQSQIERVEKQIKEIEKLEAEKQRLLKKMNVIQQLQQGRPQIVHVFDEIVRTLPDGVYLTSIKQNGAAVDLQGFAQSNARISAYMRNLDASAWFANPKLSVIEASGTSDVTSRNSKFTLNVSIVSPEEVGSGENGSQKP